VPRDVYVFPPDKEDPTVSELQPDEHPAEPRFRHHRLIRRVNMRPHWGKYIGQSDQGSIRATWTPIDSTSARAGLMFVGAGQTVLESSYSTEHILLHLQGRMVYQVEGEKYLLEPHDLLFVPAFVPFSMVNVGDDWGWWFSVNLKCAEWPGHAIRADGSAQPLGAPWPFDDEGNPVS
jgi:quercetin dioxygenase-like cupin family protein